MDEEEEELRERENVQDGNKQKDEKIIKEKEVEICKELLWKRVKEWRRVEGKSNGK